MNEMLDSLEWFEANRALVGRLSHDEISFCLRFVVQSSWTGPDTPKNGQWEAGYAAITYDGHVFLEDILGVGQAPQEAIASAKERTIPLVNKLLAIARLDSAGVPETGGEYTIYEVVNGTLHKHDVVCSGPTHICGIYSYEYGALFKYKSGELLYRPYEYHFIFPYQE